MALLKEDGSLDIEHINKLPIEEFVKEVELMSEGEYNKFTSELLFLESQEPVRAIEVDYTLEEDMENNGTVIAENFINKMREKYGVIK